MKTWMQKDPPDLRNEQVNVYKKKMGLWATEINTLPYDDQMIATLKYDGELNFAFFDNGQVTFANRYSRLRQDTPVADEIAKMLSNKV